MTKKSKFLIGFLAVAVSVAGTFSVASASRDSSEAGTVVLTSSNMLVLNEQVSGESVGTIISKAKELDTELTLKGKLKAPLYLYLNTPGGSIQAGLELIEALKGLGRPVHTITAFAASMGFQIAQNLDQRLILDKGTLMSHHAYGSFEGAFGGTSPSQIDQRQHLWLQIVKEMDEQTVRRTKGKQTLESYVKLYDKEVWLTGHESVEGGFADAITKVRCNSTVSGTTVHHTSFFGLDAQYELDNCPINSSPRNVKMNAAPVLSAEYLERIKAQFLATFASKHNSALPLIW